MKMKPSSTRASGVCSLSRWARTYRERRLYIVERFGGRWCHSFFLSSPNSIGPSKVRYPSACGDARSRQDDTAFCLSNHLCQLEDLFAGHTLVLHLLWQAESCHTTQAQLNVRTIVRFPPSSFCALHKHQKYSASHHLATHTSVRHYLLHGHSG